MNDFELEATITQLSEYLNFLNIQCQNNPFPGKIAKFSVNVIGGDKEKWGPKLMKGDLIKIKGNIAEAKQNLYGAYIAIYNPTILHVKRMRMESVEITDVDESEQMEQEGEQNK